MFFLRLCRASALEGTVATINPTATVLSCQYGKVPLDTVMGAPRSDSWMANADDEDDLRKAVQAAKELGKKRKADEGHGHGHGHGHDHSGGEGCGVCEEAEKRQSTTSAAKRFGITSFVYSARLAQTLVQAHSLYHHAKYFFFASLSRGSVSGRIRRRT